MFDGAAKRVSAERSITNGPSGFSTGSSTTPCLSKREAPAIFLPPVQHHPGPRAVQGERPTVNAAARRHQEKTDPVVLPDHQLPEELLDFSEMDWPEQVGRCKPTGSNRSEAAVRRFTTGIRVTTLKSSPPDPIRSGARPIMVWRGTSAGGNDHRAPEQRRPSPTTRPRPKRMGDIQRRVRRPRKDRRLHRRLPSTPVNEEKIPIWIADYVLMGYGHGGAIMAARPRPSAISRFARKI